MDKDKAENIFVNIFTLGIQLEFYGIFVELFSLVGYEYEFFSLIGIGKLHCKNE
jgi:hypothetical protein